MSYNECLAQLEQILAYMQSDRCDIDRLAASTSRATQLIKACRQRLVKTEAEVNQILQDFH